MTGNAPLRIVYGLGVTIALLLAATACGGERTPRPEREVVRLADGRECSSAIGQRPRATVVVREGVVALLDVTAPAILLVDCASTEIDTLGRTGSGPGEYVEPIALGPVAGGGVAIVDRQLSRLTRWNAAGELISVQTIPQSITDFRVVIGADGALYYTDPPAYSPMFQSPGDRPDRIADSATVYRWFEGEPVREVAMLHIGSAGSLSGPILVPTRFDPDDDWGVFSDGTIWVARARSNRVDHYRGGVLAVRGDSIPWDPIRTTTADERRQRNPLPGGPDTVIWPMATFKSAFERAVAGAEGEIWTQESRTADAQHQPYGWFLGNGTPSRYQLVVDAEESLMVADRDLYCTTRLLDDGFYNLTCYRAVVDSDGNHVTGQE